MPTPTGSRQPQASGTRSGPNPRHAPHAAAERGHKGNAQPPRPTGDERRQKGAGRRDEACRLGLRITEHGAEEDALVSAGRLRYGED
jgi:hypothetical protein